MIHWLSTGFSTYVLHVEHGNGYQFWSGFGGRSFGLAIVLGMWHRFNCHHPWCFRTVRHGKRFCARHEG
jgi:hypothetical protein